MGHAGLQATEIVRGVHAGDLSVCDVATSFLDRIERYDGQIQAFATVDRELVEAQAAWLDAQATRGAKLPLHGVPVGVKDIIDVAGLPTIAGFEPYRNCVAQDDAAIVAALRSLGALILGKTHTTQFAAGGPAPTCNPWNLSKSPAGSSAGSGAAVAASMAAITLGTQTTGSVLRPAAFNGVVGMKPTYGWFSVDGVIPCAWSLDTIGLYGATVEDVALVFDSLVAAEEPDLAAPVRSRIGLLTEFFDMAMPEVAEHVQDVAESLRAAGAEVVETSLPESFDHIAAVHYVVVAGESASAHGSNITRYREHYDESILDSADVRTLIPAGYVAHAQRLRRALTRLFDCYLSGFDAVLLPTVSTQACDRASETGDRRFQLMATLLGTPAISLPTGLSDETLPLGTQLIARRGADRHLLSLASWAARALPSIGRPDLERLL